MNIHGLALFGVALFATPCFAQTAQTLGIIDVEQVIVRGAPRNDAPDTGTLERGTAVIVHHTEGDRWLAIQAPRGSLSWINHLFVQLEEPQSTRFPQNAVVQADGPVKLAVGKQGVHHPLEVRLAKIPEGTIVRVLGPRVDSPEDNSKWYPIEPPEEDFRYVPRDVVRMEGPSRSSFSVNSPPVGTGPLRTPETASPGNLPPAVTAGKPANWPNHTLWVQAEATELRGDLDKAERLYLDLAREMNGPGGDADLANLCYTRIHALRERRMQGGQARAVVESTGARPPTANLPQEDNSGAIRGKWSGPGLLRAAPFRVNGKPAFVLEDGRGRILIYAVANSGIDLDRYTKRNVDLYGIVQTHPELRGVGLMTVTQVDMVK